MDPRTPGYLRGFASREREHRDPVDLTIDGDLPPALSGTLYRIGPARLDIFGERLAHWFDGDGMIHGITLGDGRATYRGRFVEHTAHLAENAARRRLYGSFGTSAPGGRLDRFRRRGLRRNPANTSVLVHGGRLFALCEGGRPWRLDPHDLSTLGEEELGGLLPTPESTFSAHPRRDPVTGDLWNFGEEHGRTPCLHFYRWPESGPAERVTTVALPIPALIHDFALTATSLVVVATPAVTPELPLALVLGQTSYGEALRYRPELGVFVGLIDRQSGVAHWHRAPAFFGLHLANAYDDGDSVIVDIAAYRDGGFLSLAFEVMRGPVVTPTFGELLRLRVDRGGRPVQREVLAARPFEFPRIADAEVGRPPQRIYGVTWDDPHDLPRRPIALDLRGERPTLDAAPEVADQWAGECVPVAKGGDSDGDSGAWLLSLVLNSAADRTELQIFDGDDLAAGSRCRIHLPGVIPFGFHGTWVTEPVAGPATSTGHPDDQKN